MIDRSALLTDLKAQVRTLEDDLRQRSAEVERFDTALRGEWAAALDAERIAATYESWLDERVTQAAVAWVLGTVFLRFCEDNELIDLPYLAGPGERLAFAVERQQAFFEILDNRQKTDTDWIIDGFKAMSSASPVAAGLFDHKHNPMWQITPSLEAAKRLIGFWRTKGDAGEIVHDFTDGSWNTRFLGDLYQDLSEHAKRTYALLQTPEFVEEFILDLTLKPAIGEFGLEPDPPESRSDLPNGLRLIDPTCGSGHFLLGAFHRLLAEWKRKAPGADRWDLISRTLYSVHGVDKNPFAVAIARFRLLIAAMKAGHVKRLIDTPNFTLNIAIGDSLIHGRDTSGETDGLFDMTPGTFTYTTEDVSAYISSIDILGPNTYHCVVGNPPYITVKDRQENENYRKAYGKVCSGKYALSVPFADRFFYLAKVAGGDRRGAGFVGQITANSFMKREFGKKLIEEFFARRVDLTHVIDTSGAYIPGHGTPTVILVGRNMMPTSRPIRTAMGTRGEPRQPENPAQGMVWRAIIDQIYKPGSESEWISSADVPRMELNTHPWSLNGGGASELLTQIELAKKKLSIQLKRVGFYGVMGADEAMTAPASTFTRDGVEECYHHRLVIGDEVRDWVIFDGDNAFHPYDTHKNVVSLDPFSNHIKRLWPYRTELGNRATFSKGTYFTDGRTWYEWHQLPRDLNAHKWSIIFSFVATNNHFVLDRGGRIFKQSAPMIKLPEEASEDDHLALLGVLNSSTACFWLKQVSQKKGGANNSGGGQANQPWSWSYEFTGTKLGEFPLPRELPVEFGRELDGLAQKLTSLEPSTVYKEGVPAQKELDTAQVEHERVRRRMVALQEELDWDVYRLYGLLTDDEATELQADPEKVPDLKLGERAFEIVLARKMARGEAETQWFTRHGSTPIIEVPAHWPEDYRRVVEKRIETIEKRRDIALIERPECKRRWAAEPWEKKEQAALRSWLLDRCEGHELWFAADDMGNLQPRPMTVNRLADRLRGDADFISVARLYAGPDAELADVLTDIIGAEHVPYLAALRYKPTGLRKRRQWEHVWEMQREEDATGERLNIPVPPKYAPADFLKISYWRNRGKLDVPKERFISFPLASPDGDGSLLLGWAGWDHREQAHALMTLIEERTTRAGWEAGRLIPLIAGLAEVLPWVKQWHGEIDPAFGMSPADAFAGYLEDQQLRHGLTIDDLAGWEPPKTGRGRRTTKKRNGA